MNSRPVYLNLLKIRLPVTGVVSIAHRISGLLLFLSIPFAVYLLDLSIASEQSFARLIELLQQPWLVVLQIILLWSLVHHLIAGIRYLLIDAEVGVELAGARSGAWIVFIAEALVILLVAGWICL
jgi:succinate dehydrogenase / fumarate reductase cytochrome b subunit